MNQILAWLSGGDLRSDGMADQVVDFVLKNPELFGELYDGLHEPDDVVRGRTADALEKVARSRPDLFLDRVSELTEIARQDELPMVRWHIAMLLGHLACYEDQAAEITPALIDLLRDESVFVKSWAIVSLCIIAKKCPSREDRIVKEIALLQNDDSAAIRTRVRKALDLLTVPGVAFPGGWIKSDHLRDIDPN